MKLWKLASLAVKTETTQGSAATIAAHDYLQAADVAIKLNTEKLERDYTRPFLDPLPHVVGKASVDVSFKTELKGSGSAGVLYRPMDAILRSAGFASSSVGNTINYSPTSTQVSTMYSPGTSMTLEFVRDGLKKQVTGVVGNMKLTCEAGKIPMIEYTGKGIYNAQTDVAATPNSTGSCQIIPPIVETLTLQVSGSTTPVAMKFDIDMGNKLAEIDSVSATDGIAGFAITDRAAVGSFDIYATTVAAFDTLSKVYNGTEFTVSGTIGTVAGNKIIVTAPCVQFNDVTDQSKNDLYAFQLPIRFNGTGSGDNCVQISFV